MARKILRQSTEFSLLARRFGKPVHLSIQSGRKRLGTARAVEFDAAGLRLFFQALARRKAR